MKKVLFLVLCPALLLFWAYSAEATNESQAAVLMLLIKPGARVGAMGESFVTISDEAAASYYNPAGLAGQRQREFTFMHTKWLPGLALEDNLYYGFLGYSQYLKGWGNIGVNLAYFYMGKQTRTSETGEEKGTFTSYDAVLSVSYGANVSSRTALGVTAKFIQSHLADTGAGIERGKGEGHSIAFDFGILYCSPISGLKLGAALHNLGPNIAYIDAAQADPLPLNIVVGASYKLLDTEFNDLLLVLDFYKPLVRRKGTFLQSTFSAWADEGTKQELEQIDIHAGLEYTYSSFLALRAGYSYDKDGDLKTPTFGFGIKYSRFRFDFAYLTAQETPLQNNTRFSLTLDF
ncbi:MAG: hypothetical protein DRQ02_03440 [Candidatus Latescibacterota bacterium]|nr:MAG: hypothetical protein DRQ02_03440 [Candidatus Latescibacterota bacterium]RKY70701.1 MAG: hypothetical protein DRQ24_08735 [Candidatus Latescibacterota bacterium]HDN67736.1 PorV/PorQ family protein [Bacillota bacterium]